MNRPLTKTQYNEWIIETKHRIELLETTMLEDLELCFYGKRHTLCLRRDNRPVAFGMKQIERYLNLL